MIGKTKLLLLVLMISAITNAQDYKIMTYNIRYANVNDGDNQWEKRKEFLSDQIAFYSPDVFGVQEGLDAQLEYLKTSLKKYNFVGVARDDGKKKGEYSPIFYNSKRFEVLKQGTFWLSETPEKVSKGWDAMKNRVCTYARLKDKKSDAIFWVFNTHFDHKGKLARANSAILISNQIEKINSENEPVLFMGDLNLKPDSEPIKFLSSIYKDSRTISLTKPFGNEGTANSFKFHEPVGPRIDYIFIKGNIKVKKYAVLSDSKDCKYPSDHLPVFIEIEM